jgi:hypothetical protein
MKAYNDMQYHPLAEQLVGYISAKVQSTEPLFFRLLVGYHFAVMASQMRSVVARHTGDVEVNMFALNLAPSGAGKTYSSDIMEKEVIHLFRDRFIKDTFPILAGDNLARLAVERANQSGTDPDEELRIIQQQFKGCGVLLYSFESATLAATRQMRSKLLMAGAGSCNLEIDEVGTKLLGETDTLTLFMQLWSNGSSVKEKMLKEGKDSIRIEELPGCTPANMLLFGTPNRVFDGSVTEKLLMEMLQSGYARRCFFGYLKSHHRETTQTPLEIYHEELALAQNPLLQEIADRLEKLADIINMHKRLIVPESVALILIEYKLQNELAAKKLPAHKQLEKTELAERWSKAIKLAGAYAFVDDAIELTDDHLYAAIKVAEDSGRAFSDMLSGDRPHVKLAKYLADIGTAVTLSELVHELPFFGGSRSQQQDMLMMATSYGHKNNIVIKKSFENGVEELRGESLKVTDLTQCIVAYSQRISDEYRNERAPFKQLHKLTQAPGLHWVAHHLNASGHREEGNCLPGFNLAVIDVDGGISVSTAQLLLSQYAYHIYTTKRHTETENRFRIVMPLNYELKLDAKDYKEFMKNLFEWLPFEVDPATNQRARKWLSHAGHSLYNDGDLLDALPFIPKTSLNVERQTLLASQHSLDNLQRWVINNIGDGNRNNMLLRYAKVLLDNNMDYDDIFLQVKALNHKIPDKLPEAEILATIMKTVTKDLANKPVTA